ncbi:uncharacterized protein LOC120528733 [Polypterus senegalus]|uniref:uncharacterized protein LOC120528733 n=1 Tax=Polypterus senegalus TaxID=55291 RepID=UPI001964A19B|nr:uncharacterized protein LOC120528733 [Polypterus senegalus]
MDGCYRRVIRVRQTSFFNKGTVAEPRLNEVVDLPASIIKELSRANSSSDEEQSQSSLSLGEGCSFWPVGCSKKSEGELFDSLNLTSSQLEDLIAETDCLFENKNPASAKESPETEYSTPPKSGFSSEVSSQHLESAQRLSDSLLLNISFTPPEPASPGLLTRILGGSPPFASSPGLLTQIIGEPERLDPAAKAAELKAEIERVLLIFQSALPDLLPLSPDIREKVILLYAILENLFPK